MLIYNLNNKHRTLTLEKVSNKKWKRRRAGLKFQNSEIV